MKYFIAIPTLFYIFAATPATAAGPLTVNPNPANLPKEQSKMSSISLGENSKLTVLPSEREQIQIFYREILGCEMTKTSPGADVFQIGSNFYLGVVYDNTALSLTDRMKSIWLELRTDHLEQMKAKILKYGIKELEYRDRDHFYFQAPGGQVFRLISTTEDMSKFQR